MTARIRLVAAAAAFSLTGVMGAAQAPPDPAKAALDRLKALEGRWVGPAVWERGGEKGNADFELEYKVTSAGKVVMETMLPGTPGEMITLYHVEGDGLVLVHYCTAGNQPRMRLETSDDPSDLSFRCVGGTNMTERDSHMHSARITFIDADHIKGAWSSVKDGTVQWTASASLARKR
jgi:hypothetical protein